MPQPIAVLFWRLGPYHFARLKAATKFVDRVFALEMAAKDNVYAWTKIGSADEFERDSLFSDVSQARPPNRVIRRNVCQRLDSIRPKVVFIAGWRDPFSLSAIGWCLNRKVPAILMSESQSIDEPRVGWKEAIKRRIVSGFATALVGGVRHRDYLVELGMPLDRIFLGYDAVDNEYFQREAKSAKCQASSVQHLGLPKCYFLASARFVEKKNLPRLLEAYARYRQLVGVENEKPASSALGALPSKPWSLVLLGDGPLRPDLLSRLSAYGLHDSVQMPGFKQYDELPVYYGLASAFVHASTTDQWGLVVNEAMASGLPVLVSNRCGCAGELVQDGVNGFTFDPYNVEQLAQLMLKVSSCDFPLSTFAKSNRPIIGTWGLDRFAAGLKAAVHKALQVGPGRVTLMQRALLNGLLRL